MIQHGNKLINSLQITSIDFQDDYQPPALLINFVGGTFERLEFATSQKALKFIGEIENELAGKLPITNS